MIDRDASMGPDGLTRRDRDLIRDVLARYPEVRRVTLFGSRAMGTFGRGSDIDLALEGRDLDSSTLTRIATELEDSDLPYKVDLLLRDEQLEPKLEAHIRRHGKPFGWERSTWGEEISLEYGKSLKDYSDATSGFRVFGTNGPIGWTDKPIAAGPGVILGRKGAYRGVHFSPNPFFVIDTAYYVVPKTELDMHWLYYAMIHYQLGQIDDGSPIPSTTRAAVYPREIVVPPLDEQHNISRALGALDDKIEQNRRTAQALEQLARAIFRAWFVDFEPIKAKAAGATAFPSMPQPVFDALPTIFTDSAIGPVPEGWSVVRLDDILTLQRGFDLPKQSRNDGSHPIFASSGMSGRHSEWKVRGPGVTTGRSGMLGQVFFVDRDFWPLNTSLWVKEYKRSNPWHAYFLLQTLDLAQFNAGSAVPTLNRNHVHSLPRVAAPDYLLAAFGQMCDSTFSLEQQLRIESDRIATIRDYLLPKLLSGQIRVRDAERSAGAVA